MSIERVDMPRIARQDRFESQRRVEPPRRPEPAHHPEESRHAYRDGFNDGVRWATRNPEHACDPDCWPDSWRDSWEEDSWRPRRGGYPRLGDAGLEIDLDRLVKLLIERAERPEHERPDLGLLIDLFA